MIVRERPSGLRLFFLLRGSILARIRGPLLANIGLAVLVTLLHGAPFHHKITVTTIPFTLMGLPLAIFLGFRNSACYDRYWEARKLWGELVLRSRNLARQTLSLIDMPAPLPGPPGSLGDVRVRVVYRAIAFAHALRHQLRGSRDEAGDLPRLLRAPDAAALSGAANASAVLMMQMGDDLRDCRLAGQLDSVRAVALDGSLSAMTAAGAACERIKNSPLPFSYTLLLHRTAYMYCFLLPFGLVDSLGVMTPLVVAIVAYTFFGLDALGDEIEEPFGQQANDLPLDAICRSIEIDLRQALGERDTPPALQPVDFCLM
ncbi:MAG: bestrophin family ion channel [Burkholderiaceae bacterium]